MSDNDPLVCNLASVIAGAFWGLSQITKFIGQKRSRKHQDA